MFCLTVKLLVVSHRLTAIDSGDPIVGLEILHTGLGLGLGLEAILVLALTPVTGLNLDHLEIFAKDVHNHCSIITITV